MRFQSTRPRGRTRPCSCTSKGLIQGFNPRVLAGGRDKRRSEFRCRKRGFNPRVLAGGRDRRVEDMYNSAEFQSTRPRGRTRRSDAWRFPDLRCFNPRVLAGGRDENHGQPVHHGDVSIHASSREDATTRCSDIRSAGQFQSTRPRGRTRHSRLPVPVQTGCFNPRVLAGGRDNRSSCRGLAIRFQSTRPRGRTRRLIFYQSKGRRSFNPRVLAGGRDYDFQVNEIPEPVSIHASSREDATILLSSNVTICKFQSTRPRGRTRLSFFWT